MSYQKGDILCSKTSLSKLILNVSKCLKASQHTYYYSYALLMLQNCSYKLISGLSGAFGQCGNRRKKRINKLIPFHPDTAFRVEVTTFMDGPSKLDSSSISSAASTYRHVKQQNLWLGIFQSKVQPWSLSIWQKGLWSTCTENWDGGGW